MNRRFILTQRAPVEGYPPVLHQAALLQDIGDVTIIDVGQDAGSRFLTDPGISRVRVPFHQGAGVLRGVYNLRSRMCFAAALRQESLQPITAVIAYDVAAANLLLSRFKGMHGRKTKLIVHLHEITEPDFGGSWRQHRSLHHLHRCLSRADLVVLPDSHRAEHLQKTAGLVCLPTVVMNCPRLMNSLPLSRLNPLLASHGFLGRRIVHYHGSVGPAHSLESTIRSMPHWPSDTMFVIVGGGDPSYIRQLKRIATEVGVADRLILIGAVPYDQMMAWTVGAHVGITMLETSAALSPNWWLSAGASNKRFEYASLGIPQITNGAPGIRELFANHGLARLANPTDPTDIARQITACLERADWRAEAQTNGRRLHLTLYNYEQQFKPVLEWLSRS